MEVEKIIIPTKGYGESKENVVQNILQNLQDVEIRGVESSELLSRLQPCVSGNISEITENLILTSASIVNPQTLELYKVSCIISCAPELPVPIHRDDILYHAINIIDSGYSRILPFFDKAADLIHQVSKLGGRTLVYCVAGVSRSSSICLAYLMKYYKLSLLESYNYLKLRRPRIKPNCGFFKQLIEYEKQLFGCNTVQMVYNEFVQMDIPDVYDSDYRPITTFSKKIGR
ncbi:dual specificity protein phosphatase 18-like [Diorhabda sublineata]|uniref:dual specificity protein phosphatase 18-like n=1 Tax=Diorhabda sublineata TaxID=1163346 RepID=UPI0024E0778A|nr:dual specificity protein phosphatase 18-like [Diorhabda sublineata]